jgi:hypothetical protein
LENLNTRNGLVEFFNVLFLCRTLKSVVQVRVVRQDKSMEDHNKIRGTEVALRSVQFQGVQDIEEKLSELQKHGTPQSELLTVGIIWAKYGLWISKSLSEEDNLRRGQWVVFGVWPDSHKRRSDVVLNSL